MKKTKAGRLWRNKSFIWSCLLAAISLFAVGCSFLITFYDSVAQIHVAQVENYVSMTAARLEQALGNIEMQAEQWAKDNINTKPFSQDPAFAKDYMARARLVASMNALKKSNDWISRVMYRDGATGAMLDSDFGFARMGGFRFGRVQSTLLADDTQIGWHRLGADGLDAIAYARFLPKGMSGAQDMLIITVSSQRLAEEISPLPGLLTGASFMLMDRSSQTLYAPGGEGLLPPTPEPGSLNPRVGSQFYELNGKEMAAVYAIGNSGFKLLAAGPRSEILGGASRIWPLALRIMGISALVSIACIGIFFKWIHRPLQEKDDVVTHISPETGDATQADNDASMISEIVSLKQTIATTEQEKITYMERWQSATRIAEQLYLRHLLRDDHRTVAEHAPDTLPQGNPVIVGTMHLRRENGSTGAPFAKDRRSALCAIESTARELLASFPDLHGNLLTQYPLGVSIVFFPEPTYGEAGMLADMRAFWQRLQQFAADHLETQKASLSIGIGQLYDGMTSASLSHYEALMAMWHPLTGGRQAGVCFFDDVFGDAQKTTPGYPRAVEAHILANLKENRVSAARENLEAFGSLTRQSGSYLFCKQAYFLLLCALIQAMIRDDRSAQAILKDGLLDAFSRCETIADMHDLIALRVIPSYGRFNQPEDGDDNAQRIVVNVQRYVDDNITRDLSLQQCADAAGISTSYLSRIFKRTSGVAFVEYVTRRKIDYVKEKLLTSQESIGEIAIQVGYSERNLYRTFVKLENMSPGSFRENNRPQ